jgi:hypothetical protein
VLEVESASNVSKKTSLLLRRVSHDGKKASMEDLRVLLNLLVIVSH